MLRSPRSRRSAAAGACGESGGACGESGVRGESEGVCSDSVGAWGESGGTRGTSEGASGEGGGASGEMGGARGRGGGRVGRGGLEQVSPVQIGVGQTVDAAQVELDRVLVQDRVHERPQAAEREARRQGTVADVRAERPKPEFGGGPPLSANQSGMQHCCHESHVREDRLE